MPFTAHDVDEDGRAYDDLIARGFQSVPVTIFDMSTPGGQGSGGGSADKRPIIGYDVAALSAAVAAWRAASRGPSQS